MKRYLIAIVLFALPLHEAGAQSLEWVLGQVEQNNASLAARRKLMDAQVVESRMGNTLEDPQAEYEHSWGNRSELGHGGEFSLVQEFDFPTLYSQRSKLAEVRRQQYGHQYDAFRQQIMLEAETAYIDIVCLREQDEMLRDAMEDARRVAEMFAARLEAGDANILEENKARFELVSAMGAYDRNRLELTQAEQRLANLNGGVAIPLSGDATYAADTELPPIEELYDLYDNASPELLDILCEAEAARRDIKVSRRQSMPKIALGYKFEHSAGERFNGVIVGLSIPIFSNRHNVSRAKAQSYYAEAEAERARTDVRALIDRMYVEAKLLKTMLAEYSALTDTVDAAALLAKALEAGHISVTDYYAELRPVIDNRLEVAQVRRDFYTVLAQLRAVKP